MRNKKKLCRAVITVEASYIVPWAVILTALLMIGILAASPLWVLIREKVKQTRVMQSAAAGVIGDAVMVAVFALSILFLIGSTYNPFIYFRF